MSNQKSKPIRVLLMMSSVAMGGAERNIVSLLPYFKKAGADVILGTMNTRRDGPLAEIAESTSVPRLDLNAKRLLDPKAFRKLLSIIKEYNIDIIHAQDQDTIIYAGLARFFLGIPTVMTRHVLDESDVNWRKKIRLRLVFLAARLGIDKVIAVSKMVQGSFAQKARIPISKIEPIYNGIELDKFNIISSQDDLRAKLGWDRNRPIGLFISVLRPGKGFEILFDSIPEIRKEIPDFQVKLVGAGKLENTLREQSKHLGDAVEFMGQRMDIPELLAAGDLLIQASWSEALPTVLIEAGAASVPVVATDVGGSSEIVQDGVSGILIKPGDTQGLANAVIKLLREPQKAQQMGKAAFEYVTEVFSLEKQAGETVRFYERVISEKKS